MAIVCFSFFLLTLEHMDIIISTCPLNVHVTFTSQNSCILLGRASTEIIKRMVKYQFLNFFPLPRLTSEGN